MKTPATDVDGIVAGRAPNNYTPKAVSVYSTLTGKIGGISLCAPMAKHVIDVKRIAVGRFQRRRFMSARLPATLAKAIPW